MYKDCRVHEMCDSKGFGSVSLTPLMPQDMPPDLICLVLTDAGRYA